MGRAACMFAPVLMIYIKTDLVPNFPTLIVSGFVAMAALLSFFAGMILGTIAAKSKQEFEFRCMLVEKL